MSTLEPKQITLAPPEDDKTILGFWIYLMTDCLLFASLFATFAVLRGNTFGGPGGAELFSLPYVFTETMILLVSSFTAGLAMLAARRDDRTKVLVWFGVTFILGLAFLGMELSEFSRLIADGNGPGRSGFLSAFFTLVGTHGLHIAVGLIWMGTMLVRIFRGKLTSGNVRQLTILSLFWHFLDIVWIFIFTIVYLIGAIS